MLTLEKHPFPGARIPYSGSAMPVIPISSCLSGKVLDIAIIRRNMQYITIRYQDREAPAYSPSEYAYVELGLDILHELSNLQDIIRAIAPRKILFTYL